MTVSLPWFLQELLHFWALSKLYCRFTVFFATYTLFVGASNLLHNSNWFVVVFPRSRYPRLRTNAEYEKGAHLQRQKKTKSWIKNPPYTENWMQNDPGRAESIFWCRNPLWQAELLKGPFVSNPLG